VLLKMLKMYAGIAPVLDRFRREKR